MARGDVQLTNPANRFFKWKGGTGTLSYYDKELKEDVEVATPFTFLLLDTFTTIKGFNEKAGESIWANEVQDLKKQKLNVRSGKTTFELGYYHDIKDAVIAKGGGYVQSCYIAYKDENGELVIGNIMMSGSAFSGGTHKPADKNMKDIEIGGWLTFAKTYSKEIYTKAVQVMGKDERICTNGNVKFYAPIFKLVDISEESNKKAVALTQELKAYMAEYFKKNEQEFTEAAREEAQTDKAPSDAPNAEQKPELTEQEQAFLVKPDLSNVQDLEETPFPEDDSDLPF